VYLRVAFLMHAFGKGSLEIRSPVVAEEFVKSAILVSYAGKPIDYR
jgi:hypothetical protein